MISRQGREREEEGMKRDESFHNISRSLYSVGHGVK